MKGQSIAEGVRDRLEDFTAAERRVARALLGNYPMLGLETVAGFAERAGASPPTVLRFLARMGFSSYAKFQRRLRDEVEAQLKSPLAKSVPAASPPSSGAASSGQPGEPAAFAAAISDNIAETFRHLPAGEFEAVAALLSDTGRRVHLLGGRFTDALALYMSAHLRLLRPGVGHIAGQPGNWRDQIVDFGRRDVVVLFDIRRYQEDIVRFATAAARRQATIVLLTDQWLSPIARVAAHVLPARVQVPSPWDSSAAILALVEALLAAVTARTWPKASERIALLERLRDP
jgi:DNA-binding MurR/RpiR family transcriptional regulator